MASGGGGFRGGRVVGDYMIGRQIGSGSFSVVWLARHRVNGLEVAVKEIVMERLSKKLQESILSEVVILKRIKHPNIIALHDIIEASGRVYLILEYCRGGDLALYIQKQGKVPEATAKHFMQQLASGLYVLRENNLIHRDLKPQNLLLSTSNENSVLKIADFGFARSLQPRGLAETLCGSPLYMAPEIMQLQKYDAKADLWSVGTILFQLVIGKTPFTGNTQMQLLQNIVKSNDVNFPSENNLSHDCIDLCRKLLRQNPVERVSFEEFFNHPFLSQHKSDELMSQSLSVASADLIHGRSSGGGCQDFLPFPLDDESVEHQGSLLATMNGSPVRPTYGFSVGVHKSPTNSSKFSALSEPSSNNKMETSHGHDSCRDPCGNTKATGLDAMGAKLDPKIVDSLDLVDQDYVIVSRSPLEMSSSLLSLSESRNSTCISDNSLATSRNSALSVPMPIVGVPINKIHTIQSLESHSYPEEGSMDSGDAIEQPSTHCMTRVRLLQQCAFVMTELVKEELENGRRLEAFSVQLVILAILKQCLHICHAQAAVSAEGSPSPSEETIKSPQNGNASPCSSSSDAHLPYFVSSEIEKEFLLSFEQAEELAKDVGRVDEATDMPDAIELIFESALAFGRRGAVDEMMKNMQRAEVWYSKAVSLLHFLLVEAPCLALNPPVSLTVSDRQRLRTYIDVLNNRSCRFRLQRMTLKV